MSVNHPLSLNTNLVPIGYFPDTAYERNELKDDVKVLHNSTRHKNHLHFISFIIEDVLKNFKVINWFSGPISSFYMACDEVNRNIFTISENYKWKNETQNYGTEIEEKSISNITRCNSKRLSNSFHGLEICDAPSSSKSFSYAFCEKIDKATTEKFDNREMSCERKIKGKKEKGTKEFWNCAPYQTNLKKYSNFTSNLKRSICSIFKSRKCPDKDKEFECIDKTDTVTTLSLTSKQAEMGNAADLNINQDLRGEFWQTDTVEKVNSRLTIDCASNIDLVRDCGWYWGPMSSDDAEKLLQNEPNGSFLVRDSRDARYIFSLTFILDGVVRHVRIEHNQGSYSFGNDSFKSGTIVQFIENAVAHSQSGRYIFFLHRGPLQGPVRVQLLHPVSRFKQVNSLQHICRFCILKFVRRDLISSLPLPPSMIAYLNDQSYFTEPKEL